MIANVHCEKRHIEETISTLKFATRMMRVKNEAVVNSVVDPTLQVKRLEKEIRDLKQELAMHDTLANRGRVNYDAYTPGQLSSIKETTVNFLEAGQYQEIENIDSLRMIREIFGVIRTEYQRQEQKIASIKRQMHEDPGKFKAYLEEHKKQEDAEAAAAEEKKEEEPKPDDAQKTGEGEDGAEEQPAEEESAKKEKRPPTDKQTAFLEFKESEGLRIEETIVGARQDMKDKRAASKELTLVINATKRKIDGLQAKLEKKEDERKMQSKNLRNEMGLDADEVQQDDIIDEEELLMLRELKDLKRTYRDNYSTLKGLKQELANLQRQIDTSKEQMIFSFENWYAAEFEPAAVGTSQALNVDAGEAHDEKRLASAEQKMGSSHSGGITGAEAADIEDEDAMTYRRAKANVDELRRARRFEKSIKLK